MISKFSAVSTYSSLICVIHLLNGAQFLKATLLSLLLPSVVVMSPITRIYASE